MPYVIEDGHESPLDRVKSEFRLTCEALAPGQSFLAPFPVNQAASRASGISKALKKKFTVRAVDDKYTRVWRVE